MSVSQLNLTHFRNLQDTELRFDSNRISITGVNGSGKTSFLEALSILHCNRSFRTFDTKQAIQHGSEHFVLFGDLDDHRVGIQKSHKQTTIRIDQQNIRSISELASIRPIQSITPERFQLLQGSPKARREYIDWIVFHVEPRFHQVWQSYQRALVQRNILLKQKASITALTPWNAQLANYGEMMNQLRMTTIQSISSRISSELISLDPELADIELRWQSGWKKDCDLVTALNKAQRQDLQQGFTSVGPHRAELKLIIDKYPVSQVLSRGQMKRLIISLIKLQLNLVRSDQRREVTLLLDDLNSELDEEGQRNIFESLDQPGIQVFFSNIEHVIPDWMTTDSLQRFHVEHGMIREL